MNKQDFVKTIRCGDHKFHADKIEITANNEKMCGKGTIEVKNSKFKIFVTLPSDSRPPAMTAGVKLRKDFWAIQGLLENKIGFIAHSLPFNRVENYGSGQPSTTLQFSTDRLDLLPEGFDCMTSNEIKAVLQEVSRQAGVVQAGSETPRVVEKTESTNVQVRFHAILPGFSLIERNGSTQTTTSNSFLGESKSWTMDTFQCEMEYWKCGLVERQGDLHVHLISKPGFQSQGQDHEQSVFHAFLHALAFIHGRHSWPFSVEHRRDEKLVLNYIQLNDEIAASPHAPFSEALAFFNKTKSLGWNFQNVLEKAFIYFNTETKLARELERLLFIFREATIPGVPKPIAVLSLSSLMESLVRAVYAERIEACATTDVAEFEKVKKVICEELKSTKDVAHQRLAAILDSADPINTRLRYDAVIQNLGLTPEDKWKDLYKVWRDARNPLSHRMSGGGDSEQSIKDEIVAESKIAGAINCMVLKLMGYSGYVRVSTVGDEYIQI